MKGSRFEVDAVLFDLDGTLLDTLDDLVVTANRMLAELSRPARDAGEIRRFVGKGIPNLVERCLTDEAQASQDEIARGIQSFRRHYATVNGDFTRVYPGVMETLVTMRDMGLKLACVTNKAEAFTLPLLERMAIDGFFDAVVSGDTLASKKPDPAPLRHACELLGSSRALMIGDSANDALAARAAGIPVLLVTYGYSEGVSVDTLECDGLLSNAREALDRIARPG